MEKKYIKQLAVVSIAVGLIAAAAVYIACTSARCPVGSFELAIIFFIIFAILTYLKKRALVLMAKAKK